MFSLFQKKEKKEPAAVNELRAFVSGRVMPITEVNDPVFAGKVLGDGLAIEPEDDTIYAPCDGVVSSVAADTRHAVGLTLSNGAELLLHEGIDTVSMNGDGFTMFVKEGDVVRAGDKLLHFDPVKIAQAGCEKTCIMVLTNGDEFPQAVMYTGMQAQQGQTVILTF